MAARRGFFTAAYDLCVGPQTEQHTALRFTDLLDRFKLNLAKPDNFTRSSAKGHYRADLTKGLTWFKPQATEMPVKSRDLIALVAENGHPIETLRCTRIGYVLSEGSHQIPAQPFFDTPT